MPYVGAGLAMVMGLALLVLMVEWIIMPILIHSMKRTVENNLLAMNKRLARIEKAFDGPLPVTWVDPTNARSQG